MKLASVALIVIYLFVKLVMDQQVVELWAYGPYVFEFTFVAIVYVLLRKPFLTEKSQETQIPLQKTVFLAAGLSGLIAFQLGNSFFGPIPFDLKATETILFLLLIGPVLEELVFRYALWETSLAAGLNSWVTLTLTTVIFSLGHFTALWFVPPEFRDFVVFQAGYTLILGCICGLSRLKNGDISGALAIHALFNLGFFMGSLM